jgi:hypothetical protein
MSQESSARSHRPSTGLWALIILVLLPAVVLPLWVPLFDKTDPSLFGFPFFFWFQFALILMAAALTLGAYGLSLIADRRREGARR